MNLIAIFPPGQTEVSVNGLHQWDYGRKLEIHASDLPTLVEVHFACPGMEEAVVRVCNVTRGVAVATIPDTCLEQTAPITAWVYVIDETTGATKKRITLPIEARIRPSATADIPVEVSDKYTEAVTAMNAAVEKISSGEVTAAEADYTPMAERANTAKSATSATYATSAGTANAVNFGSPVATAEVTNGIGETPILIDNSAYLVILRTGLIYNGILIYTVEVNSTTQINSGLVTSLGGLTLTMNPESSLLIMTSENSIATNVSGTLYFYKLGGITA